METAGIYRNEKQTDRSSLVSIKVDLTENEKLVLVWNEKCCFHGIKSAGDVSPAGSHLSETPADGFL